MVKAFLLVVLFLSACQVNNSNSGDNVKFSDGAQGILQNRCSQCHNYGSLTNAEFVSEGLIVPGDPTTSKLFGRLRGSNVGGAENMPPSGSITAEEIQIISTWIKGL